MSIMYPSNVCPLYSVKEKYVKLHERVKINIYKNYTSYVCDQIDYFQIV